MNGKRPARTGPATSRKPARRVAVNTRDQSSMCVQGRVIWRRPMCVMAGRAQISCRANSAATSSPGHQSRVLAQLQ
jgi:hypothetical protein